MKHIYLIEYDGNVGIGVGKERAIHNCVSVSMTPEQVHATNLEVITKAVKMATELGVNVLFVPESYILDKKWGSFAVTLIELDKIKDAVTEIAEFLFKRCIK